MFHEKTTPTQEAPTEIIFRLSQLLEKRLRTEENLDDFPQPFPVELRKMCIIDQPEFFFKLFKKCHEYRQPEFMKEIFPELTRDELVSLIDELRIHKIEMQTLFLQEPIFFSDETYFFAIGYWLFQDRQHVEEALDGRNDEIYETNRRLLKMEEIRPFDKKAEELSPELWVTHQTGCGTLISLPTIGGLHSSDFDNPLIPKKGLSDLYTHPLTEEWIVFSEEDIRFTGASVYWLKLLSEKYPSIYSIIKLAAQELCKKHPTWFDFQKAETDEKSFRWSRREVREIKPSSETLEVCNSAKEHIRNILQFIDTEGLNKEIEKETSFITGSDSSRSSPLQLLETKLREFLGAKPGKPTFYAPDFALLIKVELSEQDREENKKVDGNLRTDRFDQDGHGSVLFGFVGGVEKNKKTVGFGDDHDFQDEPSSKEKRTAVRLEEIQGIIIFTDRLDSRDIKEILDSLKTALRLGFLKNPKDVIPIYDNIGNRLWPENSSS